MSNRGSKSKSNQFPLRRSPRFSLPRRSPRLLEKPASAHPIHDSIETPAAARPIRTSIRRKPSKRLPIQPGPATFFSRGTNVDECMRSGRKYEASQFRKDYRYDDHSKEKRVYINSTGETTTWMDRSAGITWVAVHEKYVICIAFTGNLDMDRFSIMKQKNWAHRLYAVNVLSEMEDIANSNEDSRQTMDNPVKTPFAVVSYPITTANGKESGEERDVEASGAVEYLKEKLKNRLNCCEIIWTAISGLVRLFPVKKLNANQIWVYLGSRRMQGLLMRDQIMYRLSQLKTNEIEVQQMLDIEHSSETEVDARLAGM